MTNSPALGFIPALVSLAVAGFGFRTGIMFKVGPYGAARRADNPISFWFHGIMYSVFGVWCLIVVITRLW